MSSGCYTLPNELWREIFEDATIRATPGTPKELDGYEPFDLNDSDDATTLQTKRVLVQVCRLWRQLTTELLYREVSFAKGQSGLKSALAEEGYGKLVKRVELPYQATATSTYKSCPLASVELLRHCERLETLVRPSIQLQDAAQRLGDMSFQFDADCCSMPTLRRLEWWQNNEAERTGGINSLGAVLRSAPNLQYLFVGNTSTAPSPMDPRPVLLPNLQTLRLHSITTTLMYQICNRWQLPSLSHVIVDCPQQGQGMNALWQRYGSQVESVEFGRSLRFFMMDVIRPCLEACTNLRQLNYYVLFTYAPAPQNLPACPSVTSIGLHFSRSEIFDDENQMWEVVEGHFDNILSTEVFPNLSVVRLYGDAHFGDWDSIVSHTRFAPLEEALHERGVSLCL